jgi:hypothetical protein
MWQDPDLHRITAQSQRQPSICWLPFLIELSLCERVIEMLCSLDVEALRNGLGEVNELAEGVEKKATSTEAQLETEVSALRTAPLVEFRDRSWLSGAL